ncbi:hypothetical protein OOK29_25805 [Streptomyces phaeochromogenes]|uniref:hypothetical protein n=1 Tax=Streptomyces phaeochromogenes TaxID=1923 RepID=UPI00225AE37F|nr:hypothetical protein [Streptomyces phaeochromogenes]MCX5601569.1 hypothetical protein [Streptomyces phaeochromogenes]
MAREPMPIRTHYKEDDVRRLLDAGMNDTQIARRLRMERETAGRVRRELGYAPARRGPTAQTIALKFTESTVELPGGHMVWTGSRTQDCAPVLSHCGRKLSVRRVAFQIEHGTLPGGPVKAGCEHVWCVAPGHQEDTAGRELARDVPRQLDAAAALLGAN